jgi:glutathione synthase/RimK-type ligase-like ATP-grasp enzyme
LSGAAITGRILPMWQETVELVRKAHAAFPDRITVGWDVSIAEQGPVVLEGNVQSGCDMIQRTHDVPAGIGRLAECYAHHVREAFSRDMSMAWKVRKGLA